MNTFSFNAMIHILRARARARTSCTTRRARSGMTLLEILTVITILAVMLGVAFPMMRGMNEQNKLRSAAREIVALCRYARTEAVFGERMTEVFLDVDKNQLWLDLREPDPKTGEYRPSKNHKRKQIERVRQLEKVNFDEVTAGESSIVKDKLLAIDFYPDGTCSPMFITLANANGSKMTIELLRSTGLSEISRGTAEEKRAKDQEAMSAAAGAGKS